MKAFVRFYPLWLVISAAVVSGCSHSYPIAFESETPRAGAVTVGKANRRLAEQNAILIMRDGRQLSVSSIYLTRDSCRFTEREGQSSVPTRDVLTIRRVDHFSSAIGGLGLGLLGGFAVGMGAAFLVADRGDADSRMGAGLLGVAIAIGGSAIGLVLGTVHGTVTDYTMPEAIPDSTVHPPEGKVPPDTDHGN